MNLQLSPTVERSTIAVEWLGHNLPAKWPQTSMQRVYIRAQNCGSWTWQAAERSDQRVKLIARENGQARETIQLPHDVEAGTEVTISFPLLIGPLWLRSSEQTQWSFELVCEDGSTSEPLRLEVETGPPEKDASAESLQVFGLVCSPCYMPSGGVTRGKDGRPYPLFARRAQGCRVEDVAGNQWIDYVMGWGAVLLGHARREIRDAIAAEIDSGSVVSLPHTLELQVAAMLAETIPCAEMTLFGKNGSDVCTAAVRMARVFTGRPKVLFSGYSGWQEPFAASFEPALLQAGHPPTAFRFPAHDLRSACGLLDEHEGEVAAVVVEPAAQVEGVDGPVREADADFLRSLADLCRRHGALLVFDEILTGFRYPKGSVQKATGVTPDLACFGKALSSGMPLSVLVGRRDVMSESIRRIFYHPTFKGEAYSFAAAAAALRIYGSEDVPAQVAAFGRRLQQEVAAASRMAGVDGGLVGPPFRMVYRFGELDPNRRALMRTLLEQELLKRGVMVFRGFMLPSAAHGQIELEQTAEAFEAALRVVRDASDSGDFERRLEIPPVI